MVMLEDEALRQDVIGQCCEEGGGKCYDKDMTFI